MLFRSMFFVNTVNGHLWHMIPGAHYTRPHTMDPNPHVYELIDQQDQQNQNPQPNASPTPQPDKAKPTVEDVQLKKAVELLQDKAQAAKAGE